MEGTGDEYNVNGTDGQAGPFTCYWDVGLARTAPADKVLELWVEACWSLTAPNDSPRHDWKSEGFNVEGHRKHATGQNAAGSVCGLMEEDEAASRNNSPSAQRTVGSRHGGGDARESRTAVQEKAMRRSPRKTLKR